MTDAEITLEPDGLDAAIHAMAGQSNIDPDNFIYDTYSELASAAIRAYLSRSTLPREGQGEVQVKPIPYDRVCISDPNNPGARIVGFRIREGDEAWGECGLSEPLFWLDRALSPSPAVRDGVVGIDALAQEIRRVDGSNSLGAGALAEALMPFLSTLVSTPPVEYEVEVTGYERNGRTGELRSVTIADDARKTSGRFVPEPPVSGEVGELVERLRHLVSLNAPHSGGPYGGYAAAQCMSAMTEAASALTAANADRDRLARELEEAREALDELVDTLTPCEQVPPQDPAHGDEVRALGLRIGFGALMSSASYEWRAWLEENGYPVGSEFVSGPCRAVLQHDLARARALASGEAP